MHHPFRDHAVVIGASMAGLVAARVLSDHYARVTIIERDELPSTWANRRGVPQGRHVHALLPAGLQALEQLFPGLTDDLLSAGAQPTTDAAEMHWQVLGHPMCRTPQAVPLTLQMTRPLLEGKVRSRVLGLPNVSVRVGWSAVRPVMSDDGGRVSGLQIDANSGGRTEVVPADLVVDASGRAARSPAWLEQLGYPRPEQEEVPVRLTYASVLLRLPEGAGLPPFALAGPVPERSTGFALNHVENDTWVLTVAGMGDADPGHTLADAVAVLTGCADPAIVSAVSAGTALSEPVRFRYPASQRRRYERLRRFPEGLLVMGDAVCSFNPIYGQGMTVAALEGRALDRLLRQGGPVAARRFFRDVARIVSVAWDLSVGSDLALPQVEHPRSVRVRLVNRWVGRVLAAAETDPVVTIAFLRVVAFLDPPQALFAPAVLRRALRAGRHGRRPTPATDVPAAAAAMVSPPPVRSA